MLPTGSSSRRRPDPVGSNPSRPSSEAGRSASLGQGRFGWARSARLKGGFGPRRWSGASFIGSDHSERGAGGRLHSEGPETPRGGDDSVRAQL